MDKDHKLLMTASNDLSIGFHRMSATKLIDKTIISLGIDGKINDMKGSPQVFYTAGING
jgi:hypothetical protein